jgi:hypothetical protein
MLHHPHHYRQSSAYTDYPSEPPSPAQSQISNPWITQAATKYAYYLDRGNGFVTRLIPADVLPALNEIPSQEFRGSGMDILPPLHGSPPNGVARTDSNVTVKVQTPLFHLSL